MSSPKPNITLKMGRSGSMPPPPRGRIALTVLYPRNNAPPETEEAASQDTTQRAIVVQEQSPFLTLPGEIRNQIYGYLSDELKRGPPLYLAHTETPSREKALIKGAAALMHVCAQTRHEFRPLYLSSVRLRVRIGDCEQFMNLFYPRARPVKFRAKSRPSTYVEVNFYNKKGK